MALPKKNGFAKITRADLAGGREDGRELYTIALPVLARSRRFRAQFRVCPNIFAGATAPSFVLAVLLMKCAMKIVEAAVGMSDRSWALAVLFNFFFMGNDFFAFFINLFDWG